VNLVFDEHFAPPAPENIVKEFERQIKIQLPKTYRNFLHTHNGGHPVHDHFIIPIENYFPARLRYFYGLDANETYEDAWAQFKIYDTWVPFGLLMVGKIDVECAELCFDFRKYSNMSAYAQIRRQLFGSELLDPHRNNIPLKYFDGRHFWGTRKFREKDLHPVAPNFDGFISMLRDLTSVEKAKITDSMKKISLGEKSQAQKEFVKFQPEPSGIQLKEDRPPRLAFLAQQRMKLQ